MSIDELLSGEELKENVEKEPLLARPVENIMQTILYTIATVAYMLMCIFSLYSFIVPSKTPAGGITPVEIATCLGYIVSLAAVLTGLVLSARNKLSAKVTGYIMWLPYIMAGISFLITFIDIKIKQNGYLGFSAWITDFTIPLLFGVYILLYFKLEEKRLPCWIVLLISLLTVGYLMLVLKRHFEFTTELGFAVSTVHGIGKIGRAVLLGYQAYIWEAKKRIAYRKKY